MKTVRKTIAGGAVALAIAGICAIAPATAASATTGATGQGCTAYQYSRGGYATCVGQIQRMLNGVQSAYSLGSALAVDNSFGPATESQVRTFQSWVHITSDGIVGRNSWNTLCSYAGQVNFAYPTASAAKRTAWQAAYDAGCYVEKPASGSPGYVTISKY